MERQRRNCFDCRWLLYCVTVYKGTYRYGFCAPKKISLPLFNRILYIIAINELFRLSTKFVDNKMNNTEKYAIHWQCPLLVDQTKSNPLLIRPHSTVGARTAHSPYGKPGKTPKNEYRQLNFSQNSIKWTYGNEHRYFIAITHRMASHPHRYGTPFRSRSRQSPFIWKRHPL